MSLVNWRYGQPERWQKGEIVKKCFFALLQKNTFLNYVVNLVCCKKYVANLQQWERAAGSEIWKIYSKNINITYI